MFGLEDSIHGLTTAQRDYPARIERARARADQLTAGLEAMRDGAKGRSVEIEGKSFTFEEFDAARDAIDMVFQRVNVNNNIGNY